MSIDNFAFPNPTKKKPGEQIPSAGAFGYDITGSGADGIGTSGASTPKPAPITRPSFGNVVGGVTGTAAPIARPVSSQSLSPLGRQYQKARAGYDAATQQKQTLEGQRRELMDIPGGMTRPGIVGITGGLSLPQPLPYSPSTQGAAHELSNRIAQADVQRESFIPTFGRLTAQLNAQTEHDRANAALSKIGAAPLPTPAPASAPAVTPSAAATTPRTADGASLATEPVSPVLHPGDVNTFTGSDGKTRAVPGMNVAAGPMTAAAGTVNSQSFGGSTVAPVAIPTYSAPPAASNVASTYGLPVDATGQRFDDAPQQRPDTAYRSADATAEAYNSREDREARQKAISDLGDEMFRLRVGGLNTRSKREAYAEMAGQRAALAAGGERQSLDASAARNANNTMLANTGLEQEGQDHRSQLGAETALQVAQMGDNLERTKLTMPTFPVSADGRLIRLTPDGTATGVDFADGSPIKMPTPANGTSINGRDALGFFQEQMNAAANILKDPGSSDEDKASARQAYAAAQAAGQALIPAGGSAQQRMTQDEAIAKAKELVAAGKYSTAEVKQKLVNAGYSAEGL